MLLGVMSLAASILAGDKQPIGERSKQAFDYLTRKGIKSITLSAFDDVIVFLYGEMRYGTQLIMVNPFETPRIKRPARDQVRFLCEYLVGFGIRAECESMIDVVKVITEDGLVFLFDVYYFGRR